MSDQYFVIGIGGTGMRCIEAFTHLCAIGMFDNKEINVLSIDTDTNNGNKGRSEQLIERYMRIKGGPTGNPTANTFFSAKLNLYKYAPEYSGNRLTFELISGLRAGSEDTRRQNKALADLFFDSDVQQFHLEHGYRAQTHLGSHLMYHAILEAARNSRDGKSRKEEKQLSEFIDKIYQAGESARVFILGSIFGGTGASAIPVIPQALRDALHVKDPNADVHPGAKFGCTLLTEYFRFNVPAASQKKEQRVIADSNNFARNSQAALMFYEDDETVKRTYQLMYHIGWPRRTDFSIGESSGETVTGGVAQRNPAHVSELLSAAAAYDFFNRSTFPDQQEIVYRSAAHNNDAFLFEFADLVGSEEAKALMNKLGAFLAFAHIILNAEEGGQTGQSGALNLAKKFKQYDIPDYVNLPSEEAKDIDEYMKAFAFSYDDKGNVIPGWLFQIRQSVEGPFLFHEDAFSTNPRQLKEFHFGKVFTDEAFQFARKGRLGFTAGDPYEVFRDMIQKDQSVKPSAERQRVNRLNERLIAHSYNTLTKLFRVIAT